VCNRIQLLVSDTTRTVDIVFAGSVAEIRIPDSIDAITLRKHVENVLDHEQSECASKLWADDSFPRFFEMTSHGLVISCSPQD
jgi:hypothetical protein